MAKNENAFQAQLIKEIKSLLGPDCVVLKNDAGYKQGIPDLLILWHDKYAMLEVKKSASASHRPNQDYYIEKFGKYVFSSFVYPENKEEVLNGIQAAFGI